MKNFFILSVSLLLITSCKKTATGGPGSGNTPKLPYTPIPVEENIETNIIVYSVDEYEPATKLAVTDSYWQNSRFNYTFDSLYNYFSSGQFSSSIYTSHIYTGFNNYDYFYRLFGFKVFPITAGAKNYVDVKSFPYSYVGSISNGMEAKTFNLPVKGKIVFPYHSFTNAAIIDASYTNPGVKDYVTMLPCYPMGDDNGRRYYLNSFGTYFIFSDVLPGVSFVDCIVLK